jgi:hypothetical protein
MTRSILAGFLFSLLLATPALAQEDPMRAPPAEELDRRSDEWIGRRRWMALLIIGGTFIAGGAGSVLRRRERRRAELAATAAVEGSWPATATVHVLDPALRMDRIRKALRQGLVPPPGESEPLERLFDHDEQPALRVLILEALTATEAGPSGQLLGRALQDPADSVRSAAFQLVLEREPDRGEELARTHLDDPAVELRTLCAELLADVDPEAAGTAMLALVHDEALGPRETHALRRAMNFFAEELRDPAWSPRIEALRAEVEDQEAAIDWALSRLRNPDSA